MNAEPTLQPTDMAHLDDAGRPQPQLTPTFVVGCEGSGQDILAQVLAAHPDVQRVDGPDALWASLPADGRSDRLTSEHATRQTMEWLRSWAADQQGRATLLLDHDARNSLRVPFLRAVFPEARFVHVVRDGRDVARSLMPRLGEDEWLVLKPPRWRELLEGTTGYLRCVLAWREVVETLLADLEQVEHVLVRYEDLIERSEETAELILGHLRIADDARLRKAFARAAEIAREAPNAQRYTVMRWRAIAAERPFELRAGNTLIADLLERLGYEPAPPELAQDRDLQLPRSAVFEQRRLARMVQERDWRIEELEARVAEISESLEVERSAAEHAKKRLAAAERQASEDVEVLTGQRSELKARCAETTAELERVERASAEVGDERDALRADVERLSTEQSQLEAHCRELTGELERAELAKTELAREQEELTAALRRTAASRSWRFGHGLARWVGVLLLKRPGRASALDVTIRRIEDARRAATGGNSSAEDPSP